MKAVVLEVKDGYAAILREDGIVEKRRGLYFVGDTIEISQKKVPAWRRSLRAAVAAVVLIGIMSAGGYSYQNVLAYSYVTLDVGETSIEYTLNRRDQVIAVQPMNDASYEAADALRQELMRSSLEDALRQTVEYLNPSLDEDGSYAHVAVTSGSGERAEKLAGTADEALPKNNGRLDLKTETATKEDRKAAEEAGMSTGRWQVREQTEPKEQEQKDFRNGNMNDLIGRPAGSDNTAPANPGKTNAAPGQSSTGARNSSGGAGAQGASPQASPNGQTDVREQTAPAQGSIAPIQPVSEEQEDEDEEETFTPPSGSETAQPQQEQLVPSQSTAEETASDSSEQEQNSGLPEDMGQNSPLEMDGQSEIEE